MASISVHDIRTTSWNHDRVTTFTSIGLVSLTLVPIFGVLFRGGFNVGLVAEVLGYAAMLTAFTLRTLFAGIASWKLNIALATLAVGIAFILSNSDLSSTGTKSLLLTVVSPLVFVLIGSHALPGALLGMRTYVLICAATLLSPRSSELMSVTLSRDAIFSVLGENRLQGFLVSPNTNGALLATYVVVEAALLSYPIARSSRIFRFAIISIAALQLLQTGSLTAISAAVAGLICFFVRVWWLRRTMLIGALAYAFYPAAAIFIDLVSAGARPLPFDSEFATGRGQIWYRVSELIRLHPWGSPASIALPGEFGNGLVAYGGGHAHNLILQVWLIGGWVAVFTAVLIAFLIARWAWSNALILTSSVIFFVLSFAEVPLFLLPGSLNFLIVSLLVSLSSLSRRRINLA